MDITYTIFADGGEFLTYRSFFVCDITSAFNQGLARVDETLRRPALTLCSAKKCYPFAISDNIMHREAFFA